MRFTAFIFPLLACGAAGYFGYHLETGDHGWKARADLERRKDVLAGELAGLREVKGRLERDVALLRPESRKQQHAKLSDVRHGTVESQAGAGRKQNLVNLRPSAEIGISGR